MNGKERAMDYIYAALFGLLAAGGILTMTAVAIHGG